MCAWPMTMSMVDEGLKSPFAEEFEFASIVEHDPTLS